MHLCAYKSVIVPVHSAVEMSNWLKTVMDIRVLTVFVH